MQLIDKLPELHSLHSPWLILCRNKCSMLSC